MVVPTILRLTGPHHDLLRMTYLGDMSPRSATENGLRRERKLASPRFNGRVFQNTYPVSSGLKPRVDRPTMRELPWPDADSVPSTPLPLVNPLPTCHNR